jgi:hypothetical protein
MQLRALPVPGCRLASFSAGSASIRCRMAPNLPEGSVSSQSPVLGPPSSPNRFRFESTSVFHRSNKQPFRKVCAPCGGPMALAPPNASCRGHRTATAPSDRLCRELVGVWLEFLVSDCFSAPLPVRQLRGLIVRLRKGPIKQSSVIFGLAPVGELRLRSRPSASTGIDAPRRRRIFPTRSRSATCYLHQKEALAMISRSYGELRAGQSLAGPPALVASACPRRRLAARVLGAGRSRAAAGAARSTLAARRRRPCRTLSGVACELWDDEQGEVM